MKFPKTRPTLPNYVKKIRYLARIGAIPRDAGLHKLDILHDSWCAIFKDKRCDCDPDVRVKASLPAISRN
jgi:hypothetical protein